MANTIKYVLFINLQIKLGTRVIRGPDWNHKYEDNGEGFLGTIVAFDLAERRVKVIWDTGRSGQYRADTGHYDLRIFDNSPTGEFASYLKLSFSDIQSLNRRNIS